MVVVTVTEITLLEFSTHKSMTEWSLNSLRTVLNTVCTMDINSSYTLREHCTRYHTVEVLLQNEYSNFLVPISCHMVMMADLMYFAKYLYQTLCSAVGVWL